MAKILIIDDDKQIRDMLRLMLSREGHEISEAPDGLQGIRNYRSNPTELVITDVIMPDKEGLQTLMELRLEPNPPKVIVISGGGSLNAGRYLELANMLGADGVLEKPIEMEKLLSEVNRLL